MTRSTARSALCWRSSTTGRSRRELFEELDKPNLLALPQSPYELAEWKIGARVNIDYHAEFNHNYYSVPNGLRQVLVDIRATPDTLEINHHHKRVASHIRRHGTSQHSTVPEHMPSSHRAHAEWSPSRILRWAGEVGPATQVLAGKIIEERPHPEQGYRACLGLMRLGKVYSPEPSGEGCRARARLPQPLPTLTQASLPSHENKNIRGPSYFDV